MRKVVNLFTGTDACAAVCSALVHLRYKDRDSITVKYGNPADNEINEFLNLLEYAEENDSPLICQRDIIVCGTVIKDITLARLERLFRKRTDVNFTLISPIPPISPFKSVGILYRTLLVPEAGGLDRFIFEICHKTDVSQKMEALGTLIPPQTFELVISNHFTLYPNEVFSPEKWLLNLMENQALPVKKGPVPNV